MKPGDSSYLDVLSFRISSTSLENEAFMAACYVTIIKGVQMSSLDRSRVSTNSTSTEFLHLSSTRCISHF